MIVIVALPMTKTAQSPLKIMMIAGEASADLHGAELVKELRQRCPTETCGVGGPLMRQAGFDANFPAEAISVAGLTEVIKALPRLIRMLNDLVQIAETEQPDIVVLIDLPDFNLRLAPRLKRRGFKVVYFISPQIWAWRRRRIKLIRKYVDRMLVILPFEEEFYSSHNVNVDFVGHPLVEELHEVMSRSDARQYFDIDKEAKVIALLPGSRQQEIVKLLPIMMESFSQLRRSHPQLIGLIPVASTLKQDWLRAQAGTQSLEGIRLIDEHASEAIRAADVAIVCSGTSTLQTALLNTPMVIGYRVSWLTFAILRRLVKVAHIGLVNLIAKHRLVPELLQHEFSATRVTEEITPLLSPGEEREKMLIGFKKLRQSLGEPGVAARVVTILLKECAGSVETEKANVGQP